MTWWANFKRDHLFAPNGLSVLRGLIGISLPFLLLRPDTASHFIGIALFIFGALTDYWDGVLARSYNLESASGKILDPTMDKVLILAPLATFAYLNLYSVWWVVPVFIREIVVTFCRIGWVLEGKAVGAERFGKVKLVFQVVALALAFCYFVSLDIPFLTPLSGGFKMLMLLLLAAMVFLTLASGISFLYRQREHFKSEQFARYVSALGVGLIPYGPGTWGSLLGLILLLLTQFSAWLSLGTFLFVFFAGWWAVSRLDLSKEKDPLFVVVDETCGMFIVFLGIPLTWVTCLVGFFLFRLFDVWKPWPLKRLEKLPGYWGILTDDLGAGFYAWMLMVFFFQLR